MLLVGAHNGPCWYTTLADVLVTCMGHAVVIQKLIGVLMMIDAYR